jgi:hypothetical protein
MMIICPVCRAVHVQGTLFCEQCGTSLIGVAAVDDTWTGEPQFTPPPAVPPAPPPSVLPVRRPGAAVNQAAPATEAVADATIPAIPIAGEAATGRPEDNPSTMPLAGTNERESGRAAVGSVPTRLRVLVLNTGRLTDWIDEQMIHVGRGDRAANVFPAIDLETDGGHNAGVSRRHVRIIRQPDGYYLEDLGSINGTFLNRRRLSAGVPTELKDGDEVRIGNIVLRIVLGGYQHPR